MNKKMVTIIAALAMCTAMAGCTENDTASSSKAETTTTTTAAAESAAPAESTADESTADESTADSTSTNAGTTDYDVDGDFRAFEQLKEKYADGYLVTLEGQMSNSGTKYTICVKDGKAYESSTIQGMKSYAVYPGDGKKYNVSEATTTYSEMTLTRTPGRTLTFSSGRLSILTTHILTKQQTSFTNTISSTVPLQVLRVR